MSMSCLHTFQCNSACAFQLMHLGSEGIGKHTCIYIGEAVCKPHVMLGITCTSGSVVSVVGFRHPTISDYPSYDRLLLEWKSGILYSDTMKRTVPMARLEQEKAEGKQVEGSAYEPWRVLTNKRKEIYKRKVIIYSMLGAQHQGEELDTFMAKFHERAEDEISKSKQASKRGPKPRYMTCLLKALEHQFQQQYGTPVDFEENVLHWRHTASTLAKARSRRKATDD